MAALCQQRDPRKAHRFDHRHVFKVGLIILTGLALNIRIVTVFPTKGPAMTRPLRSKAMSFLGKFPRLQCFHSRLRGWPAQAPQVEKN